MTDAVAREYRWRNVNFKWYAVFRVLTLKLRLCGYYSKEDTPVPIPNTEVKLFSADGTWWATAWESKT